MVAANGLFLELSRS